MRKLAPRIVWVTSEHECVDKTPTTQSKTISPAPAAVNSKCLCDDSIACRHSPIESEDLRRCQNMFDDVHVRRTLRQELRSVTMQVRLPIVVAEPATISRPRTRPVPPACRYRRSRSRQNGWCLNTSRSP